MSFTKKSRVAILKNEDPFDHLLWVKACDDYKHNLDYEVIDITDNNWLQKINKYKPEICLIKPSGKTSSFRNLYQERVDILVNNFNYKVFPSYEALKIYENKRYFSYWAEANDVPHPETFVFYFKKEAEKFSEECEFPVVGKLNIGASGNGIRILANKNQLKEYIDKAFDIGLSSRTGPKLNKGNLIHRVWQKLTHPNELVNRIKTYKDIAADKQKGFVILQKFVPHDFEWRVVRIGKSFFAHKKLKLGEKASGSLLKRYGSPPLDLLDFVKEITDKHRFYSMAVDIFEFEDKYLVNEMQCIFGQSDPHQMLVDDKPGRYLFENETWIFEEGMFNQNESYDLRLDYALQKLK